MLGNGKNRHSGPPGPAEGRPEDKLRGGVGIARAVADVSGLAALLEIIC